MILLFLSCTLLSIFHIELFSWDFWQIFSFKIFLSFRRRLLTRWVSSLSPRDIVSFPIKMRTNFSNKFIWSQNRRSGRYNLNESLNKLITFLRILYMGNLLLREAELNIWHGLPSSDLPHESISYAKLNKHSCALLPSFSDCIQSSALAPKFRGKGWMACENDNICLKHQNAGCLLRLNDLGTHWSSENQVSLKN